MRFSTAELFFEGYMRLIVYADKPVTIGTVEENIELHTTPIAVQSGRKLNRLLFESAATDLKTFLKHDGKPLSL